MVESQDPPSLVGIFCLAVAPAHRRQGLATALITTLLECSGAHTGYLQVEEGNVAGRAMYERLGFSEAYRYCHRTRTG